ncbi:hypothetical protein AB4Z48_25300 [Cupriavidus sp. 2TAF22]|uniref:hypothetical protein n=1 Tax=unclassified Cupriavidus TaxID=2640874 RepID=UPI003F8E0C44
MKTFSFKAQKNRAASLCDAAAHEEILRPQGDNPVQQRIVEMVRDSTMTSCQDACRSCGGQSLPRPAAAIAAGPEST